MNVKIIIALILLEIAVIALLIYLIYLNVNKFSRLGHDESALSVWPEASKQFLKPHELNFPLWLIYGIGFNCLTRGFSYSALQCLGLLRINESLESVGQVAVSCTSTFVGSFVATMLYKFEKGSRFILFAEVLAIFSIPSGLIERFLEDFDTETGGFKSENTAEGLFELFGILVFSVVASFAVVGFIAISPYIPSNYSLERFKLQPVPPAPDYANEEEHVQEDETQENSNPFDDTQHFLHSQSFTKSKKLHSPNTRKVLVIGVFVLIFLPIVAWSGFVQSGIYSYNWGIDRVTAYLYTLLVNITQLMVYFGYGIVAIYIQSQLVALKVSVRNWAWFLLLSTLVCFSCVFLKDIISRKIVDVELEGNGRFVAVELLRVPFKIAAVGFVFTLAYYAVCLKKAKSILSAVDSHELSELQSS